MIGGESLCRRREACRSVVDRGAAESRESELWRPKEMSFSEHLCYVHQVKV